MQFTIGLLNFPTYSCVQLAFEISVNLALNYTLKSDAVFQPMTVNCQQALFAGCPLSCQQMIHNVICSIYKFYLLVQYYCNFCCCISITQLLNFRVNCSFFFKIGACRHGERCSRLHNKPTFSQTIMLQNLYLNPQNAMQAADKSLSKSFIFLHS